MTRLLALLKTALSDRYTVESAIGRGGMATVFLAEDVKHRRNVAIKVLHPELAAAVGGQRFLQEIQTTAALSHPHILMLIDSGTAGDLLYYVMPYAEGESLRQRLERERQLPVQEAVRIAIEVADGLDYAHRQGVVHRDIKPGNILLSDRHALIADFGVARALQAASDDRITSSGMGVGTPLYASPEQSAGAETLDGRTDIYSLACVLYEMLAGEPPLAGTTSQMIQARRLSETPTALCTLRDTVPETLDTVVAKALARLPADRYETAAEFGQALQAALSFDSQSSTSADTRPSGRVRASSRLTASGPTWSQLGWTGLAALVLTVTIWTWPPFLITCYSSADRSNAQLWVLTETSGSGTDSDGYLVRAPELGTARVNANSLNLAWRNVGAGIYTIEISDLEQNCAVRGSRTKTVTVEPDTDRYVTFQIDCS